MNLKNNCRFFSWRKRVPFYFLNTMQNGLSSLFAHLFSFMQRVGSFWIRSSRFLFFLSLTGVFCFAFFEWYTMVYAPRDRKEELKQKILQLNTEEFNKERVEQILKKIEDRESQPSWEEGEKDIFYL